jgi:phage tail-like protein
LKSVSGGGATAEVISENGPDRFTRKNIGSVRYEDITLDVGFSADKALWDWVTASWDANFQRKDGSIAVCNHTMEVQSQREFRQALLTETTVPALDAASKDAGYFRLKLSPEIVTVRKGSGKLSANSAKQSHLFMPRNFRLQIDGLDCTKVSRIDSFTVKQAVAIDDVGEARSYMKEPGRIDFPNLRITLAEVSAQSWRDWMEKFVIDGNSGPESEKNGVLTFLAANMQTELAKVEFSHLGIFKLSEDALSAGGEGIHRVTAELYCEEMKFHPPGAK